MSQCRPKQRIRRSPQPAYVFAALGDETRLALVTRLARGKSASIVELTDGARITRQAVTKHLRVLEQAGLVRSIRAGREKRFELDPQPINAMQEYLQRVSDEWDAALARLKFLVED
jgi:DNA-binding transcriptional ArsR family regulator